MSINIYTSVEYQAVWECDECGDIMYEGNWHSSESDIEGFNEDWARDNESDDPPDEVYYNDGGDELCHECYIEWNREAHPEEYEDEDEDEGCPIQYPISEQPYLHTRRIM